MSEPYSGRASKRAARDAKARTAIKTALIYLEGDHIQGNKFRLGAIGSQDIDSAIRALKAATTLESTSKPSRTPKHAGQGP